MMPFHSCYVYVTWKSKEVQRRGEVLKPSYGCVCNFYGMQLTILDMILTIFSLVIAFWLIDDDNHYIHLFLTFLKIKLDDVNHHIHLFLTFLKIKLIDSSSSKNKIYLTSVVDSMVSNLALLSDRHNIKSAPKERISLRIPHGTVVLRHTFYSFLIIWVVFKFRGRTSSHLANTISYSLNLLFSVKSDVSKQTFRTL